MEWYSQDLKEKDKYGLDRKIVQSEEIDIRTPFFCTLDYALWGDVPGDPIYDVAIDVSEKGERKFYCLDETDSRNLVDQIKAKKVNESEFIGNLIELYVGPRGLLKGFSLY